MYMNFGAKSMKCEVSGNIFFLISLRSLEKCGIEKGLFSLHEVTHFHKSELKWSDFAPSTADHWMSNCRNYDKDFNVLSENTSDERKPCHRKLSVAIDAKNFTISDDEYQRIFDERREKLRQKHSRQRNCFFCF